MKTIYLHLDNDTAGRLAAKAIMAVMPESYRVENKPPPRGKDVNDFLCHRLGIPIRGSHSKEPEREVASFAASTDSPSCKLLSYMLTLKQ